MMELFKIPGFIEVISGSLSVGDLRNIALTSREVSALAREFMVRQCRFKICNQAQYEDGRGCRILITISISHK